MSRRGEVTVSEVRSPFLEAGPEVASEAAVFVHGNPGSIHDWERLLEAVGEHGRAIAIDMPGFGEADKPAGFPYTVEGYAIHLAGARPSSGSSGPTSCCTTSAAPGACAGPRKTPSRWAA